MQETSPPNSHTIDHLELGRHGEQIAAAYLQQAGFQIVASNFVVPVGRNRKDVPINVEIDLVAYEGPTLCFVEVKTRTSDWFAEPSANVNRRKQRQIIRAGRAYRRMLGLEREAHRYDVLSIVLPAGAETPNPTIELLRNFTSEDRLRKRTWSPRYWD